jgi:hypothetical protein
MSNAWRWKSQLEGLTASSKSLGMIGRYTAVFLAPPTMIPPGSARAAGGGKTTSFVFYGALIDACVLAPGFGVRGNAMPFIVSSVTSIIMTSAGKLASTTLTIFVVADAELVLSRWWRSENRSKMES